MKKCLIYETLNKVSDLKVEEAQSDGLMRVSGIFGVCGVKNENHRTYDRGNYAMMVEKLQLVIATEGCPGELEHPCSMNIDLNNISHKIESIQMNEDGTVTGTIALLNTPKGQIARSIIEGGLPLYISSRAMGTVDENGNVELTLLKTYDLVGTPGFSQAKLTLSENQKFESLNENLCIITEDEELKANEEVVETTVEETIDSNVENTETKVEETKVEDIETNKEEIKVEEDSTEDNKTTVDEDATDNDIKINSISRNMSKSIISLISEAKANGQKSINVDLYEAGTMAQNAGTDQEGGTATALGHIFTDNQTPLLDPLYPNSLLNQLGVRTYSGLPMGDVIIPVLGKGTCGWTKSLAKAMKSDNTVTSVTLHPNKITCYVDIDNKFLAQDNIGFENAVRRDMQNALYNTIEATLFGYGAAVAEESPAGLFYDQELKDATTYGKICDLEAGVESNNFYGNCKYVMNPYAKSAVRQMAKSSKSTELVYEGGTIDGTPVLATSNVPSKAVIYGSFDNIAVGFWGQVNMVLDDISQAAYDVTRIVITAYVDFKPVRGGGLVFATTDSSAVGTKLA